jgi:hypothetical protein
MEECPGLAEGLSDKHFLVPASPPTWQGFEVMDSL